MDRCANTPESHGCDIRFPMVKSAVRGERRFRQFGGDRRPKDLQPPRREFGPDGEVCQHAGWGGSVPGRLKEKPAGADRRGTEQGGGQKISVSSD